MEALVVARHLDSTIRHLYCMTAGVTIGSKEFSFLGPAKYEYPELGGKAWTAGGVFGFLWYGVPVCQNDHCAITRTRVPVPVSEEVGMKHLNMEIKNSYRNLP